MNRFLKEARDRSSWRWGWWMLPVAIVLWTGMLTVGWMLNEHRWFPFDTVHGFEATLEDNDVVVRWDLEVSRRLPTKSFTRLVETRSGSTADRREREGGTTGQIGRFTLTTRYHLPDPPTPGEWCLVGNAVIRYNAINTQVREYPRVCVLVP